MRPDHMATLAAFLFILLLAGVTGALVDRKLFRPAPTVVHETPADEHRPGDGSVVLARDPAGEVTLPAPAPVAGTTTVRVVEVVAGGGQPVVPADADCPDAARVTCPDVTVRLDLLRRDDGTYRVQATASPGPVVSGIDVPLLPALVPRQYLHSAGLTAYADGSREARYSRRFGRVTGSLSLLQSPDFGTIGQERTLTAGVGASWNW